MSPASIVIQVSAAVAGRDREGLATALEVAARAAETDPTIALAVDEVLLQSHLFVGYPSALDALAVWRTHGTTPPPPSEEPHDLWAARGARLCALVYGDQYGPLRENIRGLHPDAEEWMVTHGYGRVLGRPGLDLVTRELAVVAQLAVLGAIRQLYSHVRGALRVGASAAQVQSALDTAQPWISDTKKHQVEQVWSEVRSRHELTSTPS